MWVHMKCEALFSILNSIFSTLTGEAVLKDIVKIHTQQSANI